MEEFVACFAEVADPRQENVRHDLHEVLIIALCTMLCGGEDCSDMALFGEVKEPFLRQFPGLAAWYPQPRHVQPAVPPDRYRTVQNRLRRFMERFAGTLLGVVAIDGKTLRPRSTGRPASRRCTWYTSLNCRSAASAWPDRGR